MGASCVREPDPLRRITVKDLDNGARSVIEGSNSQPPSIASGNALGYMMVDDSDEGVGSDKSCPGEEPIGSHAGALLSEAGRRVVQQSRSPAATLSLGPPTSSLHGLPWGDVSTEARSSSRTPGDGRQPMASLARAAKIDDHARPSRRSGMRVEELR